MENLQSQLESVPGYDIVMDYFNDYAGEHFNSTNPYEDKEGNRLRLPANITTKEEQKLWRRIQKKAWKHDKCFMGSCGVGLDCGLGLAPIVVLIPVLGPIFMYAVHARLLSIAQEKVVFPNKFVAKIHSMIMLDLLLTLPPLIGSFFSWMNGCSTKSAGMIYKYLVFVAEERAKNNRPTYLNSTTVRHEPNRIPPPQVPVQKSKPPKQKSKRNNVPDKIRVSEQQQSGFV